VRPCPHASPAHSPTAGRRRSLPPPHPSTKNTPCNRCAHTRSSTPSIHEEYTMTQMRAHTLLHPIHPQIYHDTHTCTHTSAYVHMCTYVRRCAHRRSSTTHTSASVYMYTRPCMRVHACTSEQTVTSAKSIPRHYTMPRVRAYTLLHPVHPRRISLTKNIAYVRIHVHVCMYTHARASMYTHARP
jgi:hypothetical protein